MNIEHLLQHGLLRQMDYQNSMYPDEIPQLNGGIEPLELSKCIADNFPIIIKNSNIFNDLQLNNRKLRSKIGTLPLNVAETPYGNADSPYNGLFVKPHITEMTGNEFLDLLEKGNLNKSAYYMQSQDGNLSKEFKVLLDDIPASLPFADSVLNEPEAVNLWIGSSGTISRLHNDNYENLFVQINGRKVIYLIPPGDAYCLDGK